MCLIVTYVGVNTRTQSPLFQYSVYGMYVRMYVGAPMYLGLSPIISGIAISEGLFEHTIFCVGKERSIQVCPQPTLEYCVVSSSAVLFQELTSKQKTFEYPLAQ